MNLKIKIGIWLLLLGTAVHAQEAMPLQACLAYAKSNHISIKIATRDVASATSRVGEGLSMYLPQVNGSVTMDDNLKRPVTVIPAGTFSPTELRIQFGNQFATNAVVQLDQVLYDQSIITQLRSFKPYVEMTELRKVKTEEDVLYNTAISYFQVLVTQEQRKLLEQNISKFERLSSILKLQTEKGVVRELELQRLNVGLSNLRNNVDMLRNTEQLLLNKLKLAMGMPLEQAIILTDTLANEQDAQMPQAGTFKEQNLLDVQIMEKNINLQEIELARRKATSLPTLSAYGRYGAQAFGDEFGKSLENWYDYASIGFRLNVPLFSGLRRLRQVQQQEIAVETARDQAELAVMGMELKHENAVMGLQNAMKSLTTTEEGLRLAEAVMRTTELEYDKGVGTLSDFLNADYALKEAQSNYVRALLSFVNARLEYEQSIGNLTNYLQTL